jgi:hypothetical protein
LAGGWRRLHNEELHNFYISPHIIRVIKSRKMRWVGHVACMRKMINAYNNLVEKSEWRNHLEDLDVDGRRVLEWSLEKRVKSRELDSSDLGLG